jgi:cytochrome c oxidase subunit 2
MGPKGPQIDILLKGKAGTSMASFAGQLNDVELAAVINYTRSAWGNQGKGKDPVVTPAEVKAAR